MANELKNKKIEDYSTLDDVIVSTISNCYGVHSIDYDGEDKKGNADHGIVIRRSADSKVSIDIYIVVAQNVKITEVLRECQNQLKYILNKRFPNIFKSINVFAKRIDI